MTAHRNHLMDEIMEGPLVGGMLDDDFYKDTMGQFIHENYPGVEAMFGMTNRTTRERLAEIIPEKKLADELDLARTRRFTRTELHYLRGTNEYGHRMFRETYLETLAKLELPGYDLAVKDGQYQLHFQGPWLAASRWEIPALAIVNGLRFRSKLERMTRFERDEVLATGIHRLGEKIRRFRAIPDATFCDFGTRRRANRAWQRYVDKTLREELPGQFTGTSNTECAMDLDLLGMGTSAHELFMVVAAILGASDDGGLLGSHNGVLELWWRMYGEGLSIALTDTFGTDFFFRDFTPFQAVKWKGLRQDSGDPVAFGRKAIVFYRELGINPIDKLLIFSDGLDMDMIEKLWKEFDGQIKRTFGFGTMLTNDLGVPPISIVIKAVAARQDINAPWRTTVKLSDNLEKAMGLPIEIKRYKRVFGHSNDYEAECRV